MNLQRRKAQTRKNLAAPWRQDVRIYKGIAAAGVTFCGEERRRRE